MKYAKSCNGSDVVARSTGSHEIRLDQGLLNIHYLGGLG